MKTIFDKATREELICRINTLTTNNTGQWGQMNVYQMIRHNVIWNAWIQGTKQSDYKQEFLGRIFGKIALKGTVGNERPMKKNMPAGKAFTIKEKDGDTDAQKRLWMDQIAAYDHFSNPAFVHDFFGKMTTEEIGILAYKHTDHHLRQFNV